MPLPVDGARCFTGATHGRDHTQSPRSPPSGTPSADVFRLVHGRAIIGRVLSEKAGDGHPGRILHASTIDRALGLWLEFHPLVACYQRADLREDQVAAWRLNAPFGPNLPIAFRFDDQELFHDPDYQGRWIDGTPFVADAGHSSRLYRGGNSPRLMPLGYSCKSPADGTLLVPKPPFRPGCTGT
jgi:hypothetical protein